MSTEERYAALPRCHRVTEAVTNGGALPFQHSVLATCGRVSRRAWGLRCSSAGYGGAISEMIAGKEKASLGWTLLVMGKLGAGNHKVSMSSS